MKPDHRAILQILATGETSLTELRNHFNRATRQGQYTIRWRPFFLLLSYVEAAGWVERKSDRFRRPYCRLTPQGEKELECCSRTD